MNHYYFKSAKSHPCGRFLSLFALSIFGLAATTFAAPAHAQAGGDKPEPLKIAGPLSTKTVAGPAWAKNETLYEVNLDSYGFSPQGAFREFENHLPVLKEMGVRMIWLMPIHPRGEKKANGSVYGVRDYRDVYPNYGTKADFAHLVQRTHTLGMHIILDWVAAHTSWDNSLIDAHPEFYRKNEKGEIQQSGPWPDVAKLEYGETGKWNMPLWQQMRDDMAYWIREFDIDGFRCDAAEHVPAEFWTWLRPQLNAVKPIFMLAEADTQRLHPAFDMSYSWNLPPILWQICAGTKPATAIDDLLRSEAYLYPPGAVKMRFLDNHDIHNDPNQFGGSPRIEGPDISVLQRYAGGIEPLMILCSTIPGKPMVYNGQEMSNGKSLPPVQGAARRQSPVWAFYRDLLNLYHQQSALVEGSFTKIVSNNDSKVYSFVRQRGQDRVLVVLNLSDQAQNATLKDDKLAGEYRDWFGEKKKVKLEASPKFELGAWGYKVFVDDGG